MANTRIGKNYTEIYVMLKAILDAGLAANGLSNVNVLQDFQPTQQGVEDGPVVYFFNIAPNTPRAWVKREDIYNADNENFDHAETQWYESLFQATCLYRQDPTSLTQMTPADLAKVVASILQSDVALDTLNAQGFGILRIEGVKNPPFTDDKGQNEEAATVDFTLTHEGTIVSTVPEISEFDVELKRV